ncbi:hypothetical protein [Oceanobacter kriegii]|uniref:hypothetical protein n=1 Tax=Oceanobacter kriegii TaxID=64972 RepID=UPI000409E8D0|nr:hypothetical protein [Oceanobacter kriegii]
MLNLSAGISSLRTLCLLLFFLEVISAFFRKISPGYYSYFDSFEKLFVVVFLGAFFYFYGSFNRSLKFSFALYVLYVIVGSATALSNGVSIGIVAFQIFHECKYFVFFYVAVFLSCHQVDNDGREKAFYKFCFLILLLSIALYIFRVLETGLYENLFSNGGHHEKGYIGNFVLDRAAGVFWHPAQLGFFALFSSVLFLQRLTGESSERGIALSGLLLSMLCLLISVQRLEAAVMFCSFLLCCWKYTFRESDFRGGALLGVNLGFFVIFSTVFVAVYGFTENVYIFLDEVSSPRALIFQEALYVLQGNFFNGAGWGVVGSHAAADLTESYYYTDLLDTWWWQERKFLYDTYWPHVFGETGLLGGVFLISSMAVLILSVKSFWVRLLVLVFFITGLFSSNMQSVFFLVLALNFMIFIGGRRV